MSLAVQTDVETSLLRTLTTAESQYVAALLERAEGILRARIPDLDTRAASNTSYLALVVGIEAEAVARVFRNPEGFRQESEGNYMYTVNAAVSSGLLDVLEAEWGRLGVGSVYSIAPKADGYAGARYASSRPDLAFQFGWPAVGDEAEQVWP